MGWCLRSVIIVAAEAGLPAPIGQLDPVEPGIVLSVILVNRLLDLRFFNQVLIETEQVCLCIHIDMPYFNYGDRETKKGGGPPPFSMKRKADRAY